MESGGVMAKRWKAPDLTEVVTSDLRALLFWAEYGVGRAVSGSYAEEIEYIIESYAKHLHMYLPKPRFGKYLDAPAARARKNRAVK